MLCSAVAALIIRLLEILYSKLQAQYRRTTSSFNDLIALLKAA